MEAPVYDKMTRWWSNIAVLIFFIPVTILLLWLRAIDQKNSSGLLIVLVFLSIFNVGLFLLLHLTTNVWISIDLTDHKVFQRYKLVGWPIFQRTYDLSQFDRISLHRAFRGGYRATLVGRDREVVLAASWKLGVIRAAAEQAATFSRLKVSDQL